MKKIMLVLSMLFAPVLVQANTLSFSCIEPKSDVVIQMTINTETDILTKDDVGFVYGYKENKPDGNVIDVFVNYTNLSHGYVLEYNPSKPSSFKFTEVLNEEIVTAGVCIPS